MIKIIDFPPTNQIEDELAVSCCDCVTPPDHDVTFNIYSTKLFTWYKSTE